MTHRIAAAFVAFLAATLMAAYGISRAQTAPVPAQTQTAAAKPNAPQATTAQLEKTPDQEAKASTPAMGAPPVLWIERDTVANENVTPFVNAIQNQLELFHKQQVVFRVLGLTSAAPDTNEFLFLIHFNSFAEIDRYEEKMAAMPSDYQKSIQYNEDQQAKLCQSHQTIITVFRPDLSYRADASAVAKSRLLWVDQFIVTLGAMPDYESDVKFAQAAFTKADIDEHYFVYQSLAGTESQTLIVLRPMKSLADWDKASEMAAKLDQVLDKAGKERMSRLWKGTTPQGPGLSVERLYVLRPDLSQTSDKFAGFDPDFWHPKKPQ
jgi:hypothetical protein